MNLHNLKFQANESLSRAGGRLASCLCLLGWFRPCGFDRLGWRMLQHAFGWLQNWLHLHNGMVRGNLANIVCCSNVGFNNRCFLLVRFRHQGILSLTSFSSSFAERNIAWSDSQYLLISNQRCLVNGRKLLNGTNGVSSLVPFTLLPGLLGCLFGCRRKLFLRGLGLSLTSICSSAFRVEVFHYHFLRFLRFFSNADCDRFCRSRIWLLIVDSFDRLIIADVAVGDAWDAVPLRFVSASRFGGTLTGFLVLFSWSLLEVIRGRGDDLH